MKIVRSWISHPESFQTLLKLTAKQSGKSVSEFMNQQILVKARESVAVLPRLEMLERLQLIKQCEEDLKQHKKDVYNIRHKAATAMLEARTGKPYSQIARESKGKRRAYQREWQRAYQERKNAAQTISE